MIAFIAAAVLAALFVWLLHRDVRLRPLRGRPDSHITVNITGDASKLQEALQEAVERLDRLSVRRSDDR